MEERQTDRECLRVERNTVEGYLLRMAQPLQLWTKSRYNYL